MSQAEAPPRVITEAMRMQFNSSFHMLEKVVEVCPDSIWYSSFHEDPFWYHVYHVTFFIDYFDDEKMTQPTIDGQMNYTYADVIAGQIRHIMYNIGYLNGILRGKGLEESDWYSYNEEENS